METAPRRHLQGDWRCSLSIHENYADEDGNPYTPTGEVRPPKSGEWYGSLLTGEPIQCLAGGDEDQDCTILVPVSKRHTPGPWPYIHKTGDGKRIIVKSHLDGTWDRMTCEVDSDDCCSETAMLNARLIQAAPELLDLCKELLTHASMTEHMSASVVERCRALITKVTGTP